jgi:ketosteroid isomerase-like protein
MTKDDVDRWLADYVAAWLSYDRAKVEALFAEDIAYRYHPEDDAIEGRAAVVESFLGEGDHPDASERDEPGTFEAAYTTIAVDGDVAVATGFSSYRDSADGPITRVYDNCLVMQFDSEGRCREFTEWFMQRKSP